MHLYLVICVVNYLQNYRDSSTELFEHKLWLFHDSFYRNIKFQQKQTLNVNNTSIIANVNKKLLGSVWSKCFATVFFYMKRECLDAHCTPLMFAALVFKQYALLIEMHCILPLGKN